MENIKLKKEINSDIAVDVNQARVISTSIIQRYNQNHSKINIDFWEIRSLISPFMRALIKPLIINKVIFDGINFPNDRSQQMYNRILEEFNLIWTDNIREVEYDG